jgi:hypothetical protein
MDLAELQNKVIEITNRPDLTALTLSAVQSATLKAHKSDYYPRDLKTQILSFETPAFELSIDVPANFNRFRAIKFVREWDITTNAGGKYFKIGDPTDQLDEYGVDRKYFGWLAGVTLVLRSSIKALTHIQVSYYQDPQLTVETYHTWIAESHPWAIIYEAAAQIFRTNGQTEKFRSMRELVREEYALLGIQSIQAVGY